jgi:hypothetical protein
VLAAIAGLLFYLKQRKKAVAAPAPAKT